MLGSIVFVQYGQCGGLPALTGKGRVIRNFDHRGITYVEVEPVEDLPLNKVIPLHEVQYSFEGNAQAETALAIPA